MTDKGIIFSAPMVRALLAGTKTQTRRLLTLRGHRQFSEFGPSDTPGYDWHFRRGDGCWCDHTGENLPLPYAPGDRLYVRESIFGGHPGCANVVYRADQIHRMVALTWTPSIHMPRRVSRLWLAVDEVRVQRLQDISAVDCIDEGIDDRATAHFACPIKTYAALWDSLHGGESDQAWAANPWIVAVSFTVHRGNIDG